MNLAEMMADIADELIGESFTDDQIKKAIKRTIRHYEREQFWFARQKFTFTTVAGQDLYGTAANSLIPGIVQIITMTIADCPVEPTIMSVIEEATDMPGRPTSVGMFQNQLRLYPTPNAAEVATVYGYIKYAELDEITETNPWLDHAEELIRQGAKKRLCIDILNETEMARRFDTMETEAYRVLRAENRRKLPEQRLRTSELAGMIDADNYDIRIGV